MVDYCIGLINFFLNTKLTLKLKKLYFLTYLPRKFTISANYEYVNVMKLGQTILNKYKIFIYIN